MELFLEKHPGVEKLRSNRHRMRTMKERDPLTKRKDAIVFDQAELFQKLWFPLFPWSVCPCGIW